MTVPQLGVLRSVLSSYLPPLLVMAVLLLPEPISGLANGQEPAEAVESAESLAAGKSLGADPSAMRPLAPQDLFAFLPGRLETWELTRSQAESQLTDWLVSVAVREYERDLSATSDAPRASALVDPREPVESLARARIEIIDTGKYTGGDAALFEDFTTGSEDDFEKVELRGYPAFLFSDEEGRDVEMFVNERFIVRLRIENQPEEFQDEWLNRIDFAAMRRVADSKVIGLPDRVNLIRIDQLEPSRNRAYTVATSAGSRVERELAEDDAELKALLLKVPPLE